MEGVPLLTAEELEQLCATGASPGRLAKSWVRITRLLDERVVRPTRQGRLRGRRVYRDTRNFLDLAFHADGRIDMAFGVRGGHGGQRSVGRLQAHWDEIGLTGPYDIEIRERPRTLGEFCAVLEDYLELPEA